MDTPPNEDAPAHLKMASLEPYSSVGGHSSRFLTEYLPQYPDLPNINNETFMEVTHYKPGPERSLNSPWELRRKEQCMYNPMITALRPFLKEGWEIVDTSNSPDPHSTFFTDHQVKPDLTVYSDKEPSNKNRCRVCDMETFIELKLASSADPFTDDAEKPEKDSADARDTRGQLVTYLNAMQATQHRTHSFGVFIAHRTCRPLRHTHSGIVVTTGFDYTKSDHLQTFFWRLSHAVPAIRGTDTTFQLVPCCDAVKARVLLNAENETLWRVLVGERSFYVAAPFTRSHHYPKCLLKDTWRLDGYHREDEVYQRLHDKNVCNIPRQLPSGHSIRKHTHYRIVLDVIGEPLVDFESTHAMVQYVLNALEAHYDAVKQAGVEHRDMSVGNIIIVRNSGSPPLGYLIDWELAEFSEDKGARACEKMVGAIHGMKILIQPAFFQGTRQFMSARLCRESPPPRTLGDDLESFALFLLPFERTDGTYKAKILRDNTLVATLHLDSRYLEGLLADLLDGYRWRYIEMLRRDQGQSNKLEELMRQQRQLETHDWLMTLLRDGLKDEAWKVVRDPSRKEQKVAAMVQRDGRRRRKSDCSEYEANICQQEA
ncbi:hypothetical protein ARMGADRAFT_1079060 [Armillaria gallica]|uniref:Fungal-type protein kinase domain-containing protein n=1 Tax=Armillaria gallica TaxID=47427 RepID=A0A2H3DKI8_ARMGA|nr:hypothetical protein ARMGADRAFT_1079060 [Armillaria gallica]